MDGYVTCAGMIPYDEAHELQLQLVDARISGRLQGEVVLCCEHPPVLTLGRRGGREHLLVPEEVLRTHGIPVVPTERGGLITYHGPGQLVVYPIFSLRSLGLSVVDYVWGLEEVMIRILSRWGIPSWREPSMGRGVWAQGGKIGSIGIAVRRGIAFHGLSLNVRGRMEGFKWIRPCGLPTRDVTTMERCLGRDIPLSEVQKAAIDLMEERFRITLGALSLQGLRTLLSLDDEKSRPETFENSGCHWRRQ